MALTRPTLENINSNLVELTDSLITLNYANGSSAISRDQGIVFNRATQSNVALIWNESIGAFRTVYTTATGKEKGNISVTSNADFVFGNTTQSGASTIAGILTVTNSTLSSSTSSGAVVVSGGLGVAGNIYSGSLYTNNINLANGSPLSSNLRITGDATGQGFAYTGTASVPSTVNITLASTGVTAGSYGNSVSIPTFTVDAKGRLTSAGSVALVAYNDYAADTGTPANIALGGTLTIAGTANQISTSVAGNTITIALPNSITTPGDLFVTGNLAIAGNTTYVTAITVTTNDKTTHLANNTAQGASLTGAGLIVGQANAATFLYDDTTTSWQSNLNITPTANATLNLGGTSNYWSTGYFNAIQAPSITGVLQTAAQPNITSLGTITNLTVSGTVTASTVNAATIGNTGATLTGTLSTNAQPNITSVGTLTGLTLRGTLYGTSVQAQSFGNLGATFSGDTFSAVSGFQGPLNGTLGSAGGNTAIVSTLSATGNATVNSLSVNNSATITGTLGVTGNTTVANLSVTGILNAPSISLSGGLQNTPIGNAIPSTGNFTTLTANTESVSGNSTVNGLTVNTSAVVGTTLQAQGGLQNTVIGNVTPTTAYFTTAYAGTLNAAQIGNTGALLTGTLDSASGVQSNITTVGTLGNLTVTNTINANKVQASVIGNTGAALQGATVTASTAILGPVGVGGANVGFFTDINASGNVTAATIVSNGSVTGTSAQFTTINGSGNLTVDGLTVNTSAVIGTTLQAVAGIQNTPIGNVTASSGRFTTIAGSSTLNVGGTATVNALTSNGAVTGTTAQFTTVNGSANATVDGLSVNNSVTIGTTLGVSGATSLANVTAGNATVTGTLTTNGITITGGIQNTPIGNAIASTGTFTTLTGTSFNTSGNATINALSVNNTATIGSTLSASSLENTPIGTITPATGTFTTLIGTTESISGNAVVNGLTVNTSAVVGTTLQAVAGIQNTVIGNVQATSANFTVVNASGIINAGSGIRTTGNIIPTADLTYTLGNSTNRFKSLYVGGNTIYIGTANISLDNNGNVLINSGIGNQINLSNTGVSLTSFNTDISSGVLYGNLIGTYANVTNLYAQNGTFGVGVATGTLNANANATVNGLTVNNSGTFGTTLQAVAGIQNTVIGNVTAAAGYFTNLNATQAISGGTTLNIGGNATVNALAVNNSATVGATLQAVAGIQNTVIGNVTAADGYFNNLYSTSVNNSGNLIVNGLTVNTSAVIQDTLSAGSLENTPIGTVTPATGTFTDIVGSTESVSGNSTVNGLTVNTSATIGTTLGVTGNATVGNLITAGSSGTGNISGVNTIFAISANISGNTTTNQLTVNSNATIGGTLGVTGGNVNIASGYYLVGNIAGSISGAVSAAGNDTQVQYNNSGLIGANAGFRFTSSTATLNVNGSVVTDTVNAATIGNTGAALTGATLATSSTATVGDSLTVQANATINALSVNNTATIGSTLSASSIENTPIGTITPNTGAFTTVNASGTATVNVLHSNGAVTGTAITGSGNATVNALSVNNSTTVGGTLSATAGIQNTVIGNVTAAAGYFTNLNSTSLNDSGNATVDGLTVNTSAVIGTTLEVQGNIQAGNISANGLESSSTVSVLGVQNSTGVGTGALTVVGGASISKDLYVGGTLYVPNLASTNSTILSITDPLLYLTANTPYPYNYEIGIYSHYIGGTYADANANVYQHTGLVRDHADMTWYLFSNAAEPGGGLVDVTNPNVQLDSLHIGSLFSSAIYGSSTLDVQANATVNALTVNNSATMSTLGVSGTATMANATVTGTLTTNGITITGGIQNTPIGNATPNTGTFTTLIGTTESISGNATVNAMTVNTSATVGSTLNAAGGVQNTPIGNATPNTGTFTNIIGSTESISGNATVNALTVNTSATTGGTLSAAGGLKNTIIGNGTAAAATVTTLIATTESVSGNSTVNGLTVNTSATTGGTFNAAGGVQNTPIGNATPNTGLFTTLTSTGNTTVNALTVNASATTGGTLSAAGGLQNTIIGNGTAAAATVTTLIATTESVSGNSTVNGLTVNASATVGTTLGVTGNLIAGNISTAGTAGTGNITGVNTLFTINTQITGTETANVITANTLTVTGFTTLANANVQNANVTGTLTTNGITITGGLQNTPVGNATASTGTFTTLTGTSFNTSGNATINALSVNNTATIGSTLSASSLENTPIGTITPATGTFTTLIGTTESISGNATVNGLTVNTSATTGGTFNAAGGVQNTPIGNGTASTGTFTTLTGTSFNTSGNATVNALFSNGAVTGTGATFTSESVSGNATVNGLTVNTSAVVGTTLRAVAGIQNTVIGNVTAADGYFNNLYSTSFTDSGNATVNGLTVNTSATITGTLGVTGNVSLANLSVLGTFQAPSINLAAGLQNTPVGNATPSTGAFTNLTSYSFTTNGNVVSNGNITTNGLTVNVNATVGGTLGVTGNLQASIINASTGLYTNGYFYANGTPLNFSAAGSTYDVQYNNGGALAADTGNFYYQSSTLYAPSLNLTGGFSACTASSITGTLTTYNSLPDIDDTYTLGTTNQAWENVYTYGISASADGLQLVVNPSQLGNDFIVNGNAKANIFYVNANVGTASFGTSTQTANALVSFNSTNSILVPTGTTAQRPSIGANGMIRFNTTTASLEFYADGGWQSAGSQFTPVVANLQTGDGTTTVFTLPANATTSGTMVSINGVLQEPNNAYSVSGNQLTFTEAPQSTDVIDFRIVTTTQTVVATNGATTDVAGTTGVFTDVTTGDQTVTFKNNGTTTVTIDPNGYLDLKANGIISSTASVTVSNTGTTIDTWSGTTYKAAKYIITARNSGSTVWTAAESLVVTDGSSNATITTYGIVNAGSNTPQITMSVSISGGNVSVTATGATSGTVVNFSKTYIVGS